MERQFADMNLEDFIGRCVRQFQNYWEDYNEDLLTDRERENLVSHLADDIRLRLSERDDKYVRRLEQENEELRQEVKTQNSQGYSELKNDLRWKESVIAYLMYLHEDGEPLDVRIENIEDKHDVEVGFVAQDEKYIQIQVDEPNP